MPGYFDHRLNVVVRYRFFKPRWFEYLQALANADCRRGREARMGLNREQRIGTGGIANGGDQVDGQIFIVGRQTSDCRPEWVKFHGEESLVDNELCRLGKCFRRSFASVPTVDICRNPIMYATTDEVVNRLVQRFSNRIPACNFKR